MTTTILPKWIRLDGLPGDLSTILPELKTYVDLATHWRAIAAEVWKLGMDAPVDDPLKLATYLAGALDDAAVGDIFTTLKLEDSLPGLKKIRDRLADKSSPWGKLLQPMTAFVPAALSGTPAGLDSFGIDDGGKDGLLSLNIPKLSADLADDIGPTALTFSINAVAGLACEAGSSWPFQRDGLAPGLLRIGGGGRVRTKAGLSLPLGQFGTGTANADASAEGAIGFFFRPESPSQSFAETLYRAITGIPEPLDIVQISHAMQLAGLEGVALGCRGAVSTGIGIVLGENVDIPRIATGTVGLTADLSFQRTAQWVLSLRRVQGGMRFVLSRDRESERKWSVGADIKLDAAPLARRVHDLLLKANAAVSPILTQIKPFLSPGTYVATEASSLLKMTVESIVEQPDLRDALLKDASIALGASNADTSALVDFLSSKISDLAATKSQAILGDAESWAGTIVQGLITNVPGLAATGLPDQLTARIKPLLTDVKGRFDSLVTQLASNAATSSGLAKELAAVGAQVKAAETNADKLLAGVREVVAKFDDFSRKVLDATSDTANTKIEARFGWSGDNASGDNFELIGTIANNAAPEAAELWRALVTGRMAPFQHILAGTAAPPRGLALDPASSLSRFASASRGFSFEFVLLGLDLSISSIITGKASIARNGVGGLIVAAEGSALRKIDALHEERSITFVSGWDLVLASLGAQDGDRRAMSVGITFDHNDQNLEPNEVNGLFAGLTEQKLIDASRQTKAMDLYQKWRISAALDAQVRGRIKLSMRLPDQAVSRMVAIGREINKGNKSARAAMFRLAVDAQLATGVASQKQLASDVGTIKETHTLTGTSSNPVDYIVALWVFDPKSGSTDGADYRAVDQILPRADGFVTLLARMAQIYDATPVFDSPPKAGEMDEKQYAQAEKDMAGAARRWMALNAIFIIKFKAELHPALLAFFRLLATMATPLADTSDAITDGLGGAPVTANTNGLFVIAMSKVGDANPTAI